MDGDNAYIQNGYKDRDDYLQCMSDNYGVPIEVVYEIVKNTHD